MGKIVQDIAEAFWRAVDVRDSGCWNWTLSVGNHGYGQLTFRQQKYTAHRVSWELHNGPIPDDLCVLHTCDNRRCVNPNHLFLGTRKDNLEDMTRKGRRVVGEKHGMSKLTEPEVREIRQSKETWRAIAQRHGVCLRTVADIKSRRHWRFLDG